MTMMSARVAADTAPGGGAKQANVTAQTQTPADLRESQSAVAMKSSIATLDLQLAVDARMPDMSDLLGASAASWEYAQSQPAGLNLLVEKRFVPLPDDLLNQYDTLKSSCQMGLFTEINRAWFAIDNRLFLWDYMANTHQLVMQMPTLITAVALLKPKPDVYVDEITHMLLIGTSAELALYCVGARSSSSPFQPLAGSVGLTDDLFLADVRLNVPTDGVTISCVTGTAQGRIFMGGNDGHLYEYVYEEKSFFGSRKCARRNHTRNRLSYIAPAFVIDLLRRDPVVDLVMDESSGTLFVLTANNNIETFYLGDGTGDLTPGASLKNVHQLCQQICPRKELLDSTVFQLTSLQILSVAESQRLRLVGVSNTGCRVYFSARRSANGPLERLDIAHIRMPPPLHNTGVSGNQLDRGMQLGRDLDTTHSSFYLNGLWIAVNAASEGQDTLITTSLDNGEVLKTLSTSAMPRSFQSEAASCTAVPGKVYDLAEIDAQTAAHVTPNSFYSQWQGPPGTATVAPADAAEGQPSLYMNELALQIAKHQRHMLVLTNNGVRVLAKRRPVDELIHILRQSPAQDSTELARFCEQYVFTAFRDWMSADISLLSYGRDQFCAMALALGCRNPHAFSIGSDLHRFLATSPSSSDLSISARARRAYFELGGKPMLREGAFGAARATDLAQPLAPAEIIYSGMHNGLALYLARLVRPFWRRRIIRPSSSAADRRHQLNISERDLQQAQYNLRELWRVMEMHAQYFDADRAVPEYAHRDVKEHEAVAAERTSVRALSTLVLHTMEALSFIRLLLRMRLTELVLRFPQALQQEILNLTYEQFIASPRGKEISREIVVLLINDPSSSANLNIDSISEVLAQECPLFCSPEDIQTFKALETLQKAKEAGAGSAAQLELLNTSLSIASKMATALQFDKLQQLAAKYNELEFYQGTLRLTLDYAAKVDPTNSALAFFKEEGALSDPRKALYDARQRCYGLVFDLFETLNVKVEQLSAGRGGNAVDAERYKAIREGLHCEALSSRDELFHHFLYEWYLQQGRHQELLQIESRYLEDYLRMNAHQSLQRSELLANYYITKRSFAEAAKVQHRMACGEEYPISLDQRMTYLLLAIANAKSSPEGVQLLHELESKQEVARVQMEVLSAIKQSYPDDRNVQELLESSLVSLSELYKVADRFVLHDIKLSIIACAEGQQPVATLTRVWRDVLEHDLANGEGQQISVLSSHLTQLCSRFANAPHVLSPAVLVPLLEEISLLCYEKDYPDYAQTWWIDALLAAQMPPAVLYFELDRMWTQQRAPFNTSEQRLFLLDDICYLLECWIERARKHAEYAPSKSTRLSRLTSRGRATPFPYREITRYVSRYIDSLSFKNDETGSVRDRLRNIEGQIRTLANF
ncbi:hypothetical protein RI367_007221 [Sorochytrium milnesiophthora]